MCEIETIMLSGTNLKVSQVGFGKSSFRNLLFKKYILAFLILTLDDVITLFDATRTFQISISQRTRGNFFSAYWRQSVSAAVNLEFPV